MPGLSHGGSVRHHPTARRGVPAVGGILWQLYHAHRGEGKARDEIREVPSMNSWVILGNHVVYYLVNSLIAWRFKFSDYPNPAWRMSTFFYVFSCSWMIFMLKNNVSNDYICMISCPYRSVLWFDVECCVAVLWVLPRLWQVQAMAGEEPAGDVPEAHEREWVLVPCCCVDLQQGQGY